MVDDSTPVSRGDVAEIVADSWRTVMELPQLGDDDDFFELGGNSIIVTRIVSYLRRELQVDVAMLQLWETPSFGEFRAAIEEKMARTS